MDMSTHASKISLCFTSLLRFAQETQNIIKRHMLYAAVIKKQFVDLTLWQESFYQTEC